MGTVFCPECGYEISDQETKCPFCDAELPWSNNKSSIGVKKPQSTKSPEKVYQVTEDFVYPHDKHGNSYGWGWALLNTPEHLFGLDACQCDRTPEESRERIMEHLRSLLPQATKKQLEKLI